MDENEAPRYWLTGKLYCGECGSTMQGVSGTSATGRTYYYYYCSAQRRKECHLHKARKQDLEDMVLFALHNIVDDEENVTALALNAAEYYEKNHNDTAYLEAQGSGEKPCEPREGHREGRGQRYGYAAPMLLRSTRSASSESTHPSPLKSIMSSLPSVSNPSAYLIISKASYVVISPSWFTSPIIQ